MFTEKRARGNVQDVHRRGSFSQASIWNGDTTGEMGGTGLAALVCCRPLRSCIVLGALSHVQEIVEIDDFPALKMEKISLPP